MTREEREKAIAFLKDMQECTYDGLEEIRNAIKALEQEPFINKPCVSEKVCEHDKQMVLNKIRAEIAELSHYYPMGHDYQIAITRCLAVIDKYKTESEG